MPRERSSADRIRLPRFLVGEVIVMTKAAVKAGLLGRATRNRAVVVGLEPISWASRRVMGVVVRKAGLRSAQRYWCGFWRHRRPGERP